MSPELTPRTTASFKQRQPDGDIVAAARLSDGWSVLTGPLLSGDHPRVPDERETFQRRAGAAPCRTGRAGRVIAVLGVLLTAQLLVGAAASVVDGQGGPAGAGLRLLLAGAAGAGLWFSASRLMLSRRAIVASAVAMCGLAALLYAAPGWRQQLEDYHARRLAALAEPTPYRDPVGADRTQCNDLVDDSNWLARLLAAGSCDGRLDSFEVFSAAPCAEGRTFYYSPNYAGLSDGPLVERYGTITLSFDNPDYAICHYGASAAPTPAAARRAAHGPVDSTVSLAAWPPMRKGPHVVDVGALLRSSRR